MNIGQAFAYVFEDDEWITKILIAAAIILVGILLAIFIIPAFLAGFLLGGYGVEITRRVIRGQSPVLPKWDNWGDLLIDGVKAWVIGIIYWLPVILVGLCMGPVIAVLGENSEALSATASTLLSCLNLLWGIVAGLLLPAAIAIFVANDDVSAAFRFGDVFALVRDNFSTYLIVLVIGWVTGFIGGLGLLVCGVGVLVTGPYAGWVTAHLRGQAYLQAAGQAPQSALEESLA
jgi:hypothetical protein